MVSCVRHVVLKRERCGSKDGFLTVSMSDCACDFTFSFVDAWRIFVYVSEGVRLCESDTHEGTIADRLKSIGWETIGVQFDQFLPIAHNLIISKMRFELEWLLLMHRGQRCVHHMVELLLENDHRHRQ